MCPVIPIQGGGKPRNFESFAMAVAQPRYQLMAQSLLADITNKRYPVGSLLPTEAKLCEQFGVSRHTVREAMRQLLELGLVSRRQGIGTRVERIPSETSFLLSAHSIYDVMQYIAETTLVILGVNDVVADDRLSEQLSCNRGRRWLHIKGYRQLTEPHGPPISCSEIYVNAAFSGVRDMLPPRETPIHGLIERHYGERIVELRQDIKAVPMPADYAKILEVPENSPGLHIMRHFINSNGEPLEISINTHPSDRFNYTFRLRRDRKI